MLLRRLHEHCTGALLSGKGEEANAVVGGEVTGCWEGTTDGRKHCSGSWKVRAQVGFASPGSAGAAGRLLNLLL